MKKNEISASHIENLCLEKEIKMTKQRKAILSVIAENSSLGLHSDAEKIYEKSKLLDYSIGIATVYRFLALLSEKKIIEKHNFLGSEKSRYEFYDKEDHHDHLIDISTGEVVEFFNKELEALKCKIASDFGYELIDHKLELFCIKKNQKD